MEKIFIDFPLNIQEDIVSSIYKQKVLENPATNPHFRNHIENPALRVANSSLFIPNAVNNYIKENRELFISNIPIDVVNYLESAGDYVSLTRGWEECDRDKVMSGIMKKIEQTYPGIDIEEANRNSKKSGAKPYGAEWHSYKSWEIQNYIEIERYIFIKIYNWIYNFIYMRENNKNLSLCKLSRFFRGGIPHQVCKLVPNPTLVWITHIGYYINGPCYCCKTPLNLTGTWEAGHIVSHADGGPDTADNLRPICVSCNRSMGTENMDAFKARCYP